MPVLPLVCLCLGLLWLRPRPVATGVVAAALTPGLAVLCTLASATQLGWFAYPIGLRAWLQSTRLPSLAAAAGTRASPGRCGFLPGSPSRRRNGWRELTRQHALPAGLGLICGRSSGGSAQARDGPAPWGKQGVAAAQDAGRATAAEHAIAQG